MKKIATATIATAGVATIAIAGHGHEAHAAEQGYNPNDPTSYSYSYTIDQQGNYHYTWKGNWSPDRLNHSNNHYSYSYNNYNNNNNYSYNNYNNNNSNQVSNRTYNYNNSSNQTSNRTYNYNNYNSNNSYQSNASSNNNTQSYTYTSNNKTTNGLGSTTASTSNQSVKVTTTTAPSSNGVSISNASYGGANAYYYGQCTYYVYNRVGGKIGSHWGNANNWANAAAAAGYTVNNTPSVGSIMQTTAGGYGHVAYVENVNSNGSVTISEMNYNGQVGIATSRTLSSSEAASYNYIH